MRADVILIRVIFTAALVIAGYKLVPVGDDPWISAAAGALIALCIIVFELRIRRATLKTLIGAAAEHEDVFDARADVLHGVCRPHGRSRQGRLSRSFSARRDLQ